VWEYLQRVIASNEGGLRASEQQARNLAGAFLFSGSEQEKCVGNLSGGERGRMVIAGLVSAANNLIVLDEPTNHLDIPSAERLEAAIATPPEDGGYDGALILISHDRALLASCCERLVILDGHGGARLFDGNWDEWEAKEAEERAAREAGERAAAARKAGNAKAAAPAAKAVAAPAGAKPAGAPSGGRKGGDRPAMTVEQIEARITEIERRTREIDESLLDPKVYADAKRSKQLAQERERLQQELEPLEFEWSRRVG
jgi:ATP-binding cassette subfamily F protein 3